MGGGEQGRVEQEGKLEEGMEVEDADGLHVAACVGGGRRGEVRGRAVGCGLVEAGNGQG